MTRVLYTEGDVVIKVYHDYYYVVHKFGLWFKVMSLCYGEILLTNIAKSKSNITHFHWPHYQGNIES